MRNVGLPLHIPISATTIFFCRPQFQVCNFLKLLHNCMSAYPHICNRSSICWLKKGRKLRLLILKIGLRVSSEKFCFAKFGMQNEFWYVAIKELFSRNFVFRRTIIFTKRNSTHKKVQFNAVLLLNYMMSANLHGAYLPVWCFSIWMMSAQLYDVCLRGWCLLKFMMSPDLYDVCSTGRCLFTWMISI